MRIFLSILISLTIISYSQCQEKIKTKRIRENHQTFLELYNVLKKDKSIKHGAYKKVRLVTNEVIEIGTYNMDKKVGVWEFYNDQSGKTTLEQKYDFDTDSLLFNDPEENTKFEIFINNNWELKELKTPPIQIGGQLNLYLEILKNVKITESMRKNKKAGFLIINLIINEDGKIKNTETLTSLGEECDTAILEAISKIDSKWIIPNFEGKKYNIKYPLIFEYKSVTLNLPNNQHDALYFVDSPKNKCENAHRW